MKLGTTNFSFTCVVSALPGVERSKVFLVDAKEKTQLVGDGEFDVFWGVLWGFVGALWDFGGVCGVFGGFVEVFWGFLGVLGGFVGVLRSF